MRCFLRQFLSDPFVVDLPRLPWLLLLNLVILPFRAPKSARLYEKIWTNEGSPLLVITQKQVKALRQFLPPGVPVAIGMRYGTPSIDSGVDELTALGCTEIIVLPMYPQYSRTTTQTTLAAAERAVNQHPRIKIRTVKDFHDDTAYIGALASSIEQSYTHRDPAEHLVISFHGIPQRYAEAGDPYPDQCEATARLLAEALGLEKGTWTLAYQSRFGREKWLEPFTDDVLRDLGQQRTTSLEILCPGFPADCLETLEEIRIRGREIFTSAGGGEYHYVPALNDDEKFINALAGLIKGKMI